MRKAKNQDWLSFTEETITPAIRGVIEHYLEVYDDFYEAVEEMTKEINKQLAKKGGRKKELLMKSYVEEAADLLLVAMNER